jgi:hypothetical protein
MEEVKLGEGDGVVREREKKGFGVKSKKGNGCSALSRSLYSEWLSHSLSRSYCARSAQCSGLSHTLR